MNSKLRKAQFARNMSRNEFRRFAKSHWEETRKMRNYVVKILQMSLKNYFTKHCEKQDKNFWHTVSPFMSDKSTAMAGILHQMKMVKLLHMLPDCLKYLTTFL